MLVCTGLLNPATAAATATRTSATAAATAAATSARAVVFFYVSDQWNERGCQDF